MSLSVLDLWRRHNPFEEADYASALALLSSHDALERAAAVATHGYQVEDVAREHGLDEVEQYVLGGLVEGHVIVVRMPVDRRPVVSLALHPGLPAGLAIRPQRWLDTLRGWITRAEPQAGEPRVDDALLLAGPSRATAEGLFSDRKVRRALLALVDAGCLVSLHDQALAVAAPTPDAVGTRVAIKGAIRLASSLAQAWMAAWAATGLTLSDAGDELTGELEGCRVQVRYQPDDDLTVIYAPLFTPLPSPIHAAGDGGGLSLGDVILDGRIEAPGPVPRARVCSDAVRGPLLAVFSRGEAAVGSGAVFLEVRGRAFDIAAILDDVVALVNGLG